jgi:hypothetical protein
MESLWQEHRGAILRPCEDEFDSGGSAFACAFVDKDDAGTIYLYYSGASDKKWTHAAIGLAVSHDGATFRKLSSLNPILDGRTGEFNSAESVTPAVVRLRSHYYMFFAASSMSGFIRHRRKIAVAYADDPSGPWQVLGIVAKPEGFWEGSSIDLGPSVVKLGEDEALLYYSNLPSAISFRSGWCRRRVGILKVRVNSPRSIAAERYLKNPLTYLNGTRGSPNESVFCPGYLRLEHEHCLMPSMSTYSVGFPYRQSIGIAWNGSPYFESPDAVAVVLDGEAEAKVALPKARIGIGLDSPSPLVRNGRVCLYYSVLDRQEGSWMTALSIADVQSLRRLAEGISQGNEPWGKHILRRRN